MVWREEETGGDAAIRMGTQMFYLSPREASSIRHLTLQGGWDVVTRDRGEL